MNRIIKALIFAFIAFFALFVIFLVLGIISEEPYYSFFKLIYRHQETWLPLIIFPPICAFIAALLVVNKITFDADKIHNNRKSWLIISPLIVIVSILIYAIVMYFYLPKYDRFGGFKLSLIATTYFSWALYPLAFMAGFKMWRW